MGRKHTLHTLSAFAPESLVSRDGFGSPVPHQPAHLHTQAESRAYLRGSSRVPRRRPFIYLKPPYAIGSVPSLSGHTICVRENCAIHVYGFLGFNRPLTAAAFHTTDADLLDLRCTVDSKKNLTTSRPSEHPGGIIGCKDKRALMVVTLGQQYHVGACFSVA